MQPTASVCVVVEPGAHGADDGARVTEEFREAVGADPAAVGSAPGRVNLIGEHLDYNGGTSLPIALSCRTYAAVAPRGDGRLVVRSVQQGGPVHVPFSSPAEKAEGWTGYVAGVVWALGIGGTGWDVVVDGRVPAGAGLSSSAALECAVAMAVVAASGATPSRREMVEACVRAENEYVGAPTGSMDQTVAMFAQADHALLIDFGSGGSRLVPWSPPGELVVIDTRASHALVGGEYAERRASCEAAAAALGVPRLASAHLADVEALPDPVERRRAHHVVTEQARVAEAVDAIERGEWQELGRVMTASHRSLRDDYEVSCRELDIAVESALEAGAWGARMTGGGFGGSAIALVPLGRGDAIRDAVESAFAAEGLRAPAFVDGASGGPAVVLSLRRG
jgi:galactokinase